MLIKYSCLALIVQQEGSNYLSAALASVIRTTHKLVFCKDFTCAHKFLSISILRNIFTDVYIETSQNLVQVQKGCRFICTQQLIKSFFAQINVSELLKKDLSVLASVWMQDWGCLAILFPHIQLSLFLPSAAIWVRYKQMILVLVGSVVFVILLCKDY